MKKHSRENEEFWSGFVSDLKEEILTKGLLTGYTENLKKSKKREDGHTHAQSYVDHLIDNVFPSCETIKNYGFDVITPRNDRDHGDFYLVESESKKAIKCNGKLGTSKRLGLPNICAITRAFDYLSEHSLPYLIFKLRLYNGEYTLEIFDLYNNMDVIVYNDGPGQLMINEKKFYEKKEFKYLKTLDVLRYLLRINEVAFDNLIKQRQKKLNKHKEMLLKYESNQVQEGQEETIGSVHDTREFGN
jgi:hypothetical protein